MGVESEIGLEGYSINHDHEHFQPPTTNMKNAELILIIYATVFSEYLSDKFFPNSKWKYIFRIFNVTQLKFSFSFRSIAACYILDTILIKFIQTFSIDALKIVVYTYNKLCPSKTPEPESTIEESDVIFEEEMNESTRVIEDHESMEEEEEEEEEEEWWLSIKGEVLDYIRETNPTLNNFIEIYGRSAFCEALALPCVSIYGHKLHCE